MNATDTALSKQPSRRLTGQSVDFGSRGAIESYIDGLNRRAPLAHRDIGSWGASSTPSLQVTMVPMAAAGGAREQIFLAESQNSFVLDMRAEPKVAAGAPYLVGLVLSGSVSLTQAGGEFVARAGEGIIISPAEVERAQFSANSHFIEFVLPRNNLLRLGSELAPGELSGEPEFTTLLAPPLAQGLLFMARQAARLLQSTEPTPGSQPMFERWMEMIALTLLHEQQAGRSPQVLTAAMQPRSLSRALDYIDANAQRDILLSDIAAAACVSVSSLLRHFNEHMGQSPMAFLRQVRLDRARAELRRGDAGLIRDLALRWGFQSAGKFSQAYLRRFGERPSDGR
ncbi:AraC family transcriptional regulator [Roseateles oligotrophus]|uniref:AraC family transcriptional regulator n=1 Tax=Roseateles oligotrophus TaxID=1769250 RepID=A0ABT2YDI2_9BURK|nr:AraC family transcriptional regulator [Roseateles oligotrophus]MCV2368097.1 AraC family transcriptional regulator [Roseateles oligotrophus]